ncbi:protein transport protein SEC16A homolog [Dendrobium catenatum]|uniref:Protein transport protein sec16 n=1 Tax=Dendrobium catenatum TaxID=906689 RepID=A0A2I0VK25_9ASPA|nr:protein transport protein SEC16A homolog [Dendrobium catenatum]XP_028556993.1 protein transport protein SEC16A homolog [Dendrobium catenatum]PKU63755.1 hypothetical protein MA16_Dca010673 [Dendrobium catenatum]
MASPPMLPVEDQTDEDFFDRLVEDEFGDTGLREGSIEVDRSFLETGVADERMKLEDSDDTRVSSVEEDELENRTNQASQNPKEGVEWMASVESSNLLLRACEAETVVSEERVTDVGSSLLSSEVGSGSPAELKSEIRSSDSSVEQSGGSKSAGVKEVQWSAFCADSQQFSFSDVEPFSDFLLENSDVSTNQENRNGDLKSNFFDNAVAGHGEDLVSSEQQDSYIYGTDNGYSTDANDPKYWENLYPGWKFDASTGQWYQVDGNDAVAAQSDNYDATDVNVQESFRNDHLGDGSGFISGKAAQVSYSQQNSSLMVGGVAEDCKTGIASSCNQHSQSSNGYPPNMVFDPQYPGWYFDTNTQQWYTLDEYAQSIQQTSHSVQGQVIGDMNTCNGFIGEASSSFYGDVGPLEQNGIQGQGNQNLAHSWDVLTNKFAQQNIHQFDANDNSNMSFSGNQQMMNFYDPKLQEMNNPSQKVSFNSWSTFPSVYSNSKASAGFQNFVPAESMQLNQPKAEQSLQSHLSQSFYAEENSLNYHGQQFYSTSYPNTSYAGNEGRSSAGRPPHALVTFGFGGKLVVMKDPNTSGMNTGFDNKEASEGAVSILNLMEVVKDQAEIAGDYFHSLAHHSFPGPLVGGNASTKDVYKWIDESITHCESPTMDPKKGKMLKLLLSLLKISCQHYGKLRSPFGSGLSLEEDDGPESSVTKLFASARADLPHLTHFMQSSPSAANIQATSIEMQNLLVSGKRKEALQCAQVGQLWGPALVLAAQLGEKFYVDTVKQMAHRLLICGSPLRTLCLLIAGQPADVFATESSAIGSFPSTANADEQPSKVQSNYMLDDWEENLAIITANRTKDDELVVIHLGDCLWKERGEVTAAHTCYLAAEANFESYSDSARLCLIGADHWKYPRTYAGPDAIQRTELYEYAKVLGNSQFVLHPFQPYKLIYANMLAEIGKTSDSLRYCQASMKLLRNSTRTPEVEIWKSLLSSLEERLSAHQQGGYGENLAPSKIVGKLFTSIDRSIHRMMGAPSSLPPMPQNNANGKGSHLVSTKVVNSQSTMAMSTLIPSASVDGMSEWTTDSGRKSLHSRSISEPDFGRTPKQDAKNRSSSGDAQNKTSPSRFGRIGSQFFQKTVSWVSRSRSDRQAKLGESNKFYYDEKLKRWVEEGAEPPEEVSLPPPPKITSFQNGTTEYNINNALKNQNLTANRGSETKSPTPSESSGIPPMSPSPSQFSARRMGGVRSRYVDTFNKGSDSLSNSFQSPSAPAAKPAAAAKFFVPAAPSNEDVVNSSGAGIPETGTDGDLSTSLGTEISFNSPSPPPPPSSTIERLPTMTNIDPYKNKETTTALQNGNGFLSHSPMITSNAKFNEITPFFPSNPATVHPSSLLQQFNVGSPGEDLDEVELS